MYFLTLAFIPSIVHIELVFLLESQVLSLFLELASMEVENRKIIACCLRQKVVIRIIRL